ncbi:sugar ABC transporter ATP-binding protein [Frankia tisae]|uniref:sugar ABC transporter ATP-binding protein n=1 Tax=Frankia tisae TaxID=2950104 RepID=UPI0021C213D5|nr:sugar ABC transporter ATP-binding protein [Frankia tisae]
MAAGTMLSISGVSRSFGATRALDDVSLTFPGGSVTALLGENGSGKSTLIKILAGVLAPDPGRAALRVREAEVALPLSPARAHALGLRFLHQDLGLMGEATVADNIGLYSGYLSRALTPLRSGQERRRAALLLERFEVRASPDDYVCDLSLSDQTMVAIARAFEDADGDASRILVLDEPTAALPDDEVDRVFGAIRRARDAGAAVILVSHRLEEVLQIADRVAVLRDGRLVRQRPVAGLAAGDLVEMMIGKDLTEYESAPTAVDELHQPIVIGRGLHGRRLAGVDIEIYPGEVLGVGGLVGSGRSELTRILGGAQRPRRGTLEVGGRPRSYAAPHAAVADGIVTVPQNRRRDGVLGELTVRENLTLGDLRSLTRWSMIDRAREKAEARTLIEQFDIRPRELEFPVRLLSGGNQQKVAIARAVRLRPRVLVLDEPTQGIDVGARREVAGIIRRLKADGMAIVLGTSDGDELLDLADRALILDRGRTRRVFGPGELTRSRLTHATAGVEGRSA